MSLEASVGTRRGDLDLRVDVEVADGEVLALLGPNGAGKSTFVRVLAGLLPPDRGRVVVGGEVWDDGVTSRPAHRRALGMVFQDALLFPHLSVADNVAFGLRTRGARRGEARAAAAAWLTRVGLDGLGARRPAELSGGQAQRAALARALVGDPALLLLDEPLSALDARTRLTVRAELRRHLAAFRGSTVLVTHDPVDAMALADRVVVLEEGRVVQTGTPAEVARRPRTDYVARLVGLSLLPGTGAGRSVRLDCGAAVAIAEEAAGPVFAAIRPESVALYTTRPDGSTRNLWRERVVGATPHGATVRCELDGEVPLVADVTATSFAEMGLVPGAEVWAGVKASEVAVYAR
ncbi:ABC transporter ATP-binding protein [Blastococcus sp. MG754426]|uniref:ABC transporter ATP-binding protein n=1 Tax=unclassified Blastococcus TaxID=2619396 RepID=UPI001EF0A425|nr:MULTISPECIES: ABC transporter ATP-binding protein [unclassified Blastococcus]MCF6506771.1 ABC transporter ATP-binding protein [Blastococcus sp. MG754426]MCF6511342.1 ABC transporter ATP-binding protein [Blastococcus sp. MG754427]